MHRHLSGVIKGANKDFRPRPVHLTLQNHENFQHEEKKVEFHEMASFPRPAAGPSSHYF